MCQWHHDAPHWQVDSGPSRRHWHLPRPSSYYRPGPLSGCCHRGPAAAAASGWRWQLRSLGRAIRVRVTQCAPRVATASLRASGTGSLPKNKSGQWKSNVPLAPRLAHCTNSGWQRAYCSMHHTHTVRTTALAPNGSSQSPSESTPDHLNPGRLNRDGFGRVGPGPKPLRLRRGLFVRVACLARDLTNSRADTLE